MTAVLGSNKHDGSAFVVPNAASLAFFKRIAIIATTVGAAYADSNGLGIDAAITVPNKRVPTRRTSVAGGAGARKRIDSFRGARAPVQTRVGITGPILLRPCCTIG